MIKRIKKYFKNDNLEYEFLPPALEIEETPPAPFKRALIWIILIIVVAAFIWAYVGKVDEVAVARGKVIPDGKLKVIQPVDTGVVRAIHVKEGQRIKEGQLLIELDPTMAEANLEGLKSTLKIVEEQEATLRDLAEGGYVSRNDWLQKRKELISLKSELSKAVRRNQLERLVSPIDGTVHELAAHTIGGVVTSAQPLLTIVPEDTPLVIEAFVLNQDIGFVSVGQTAELKFDTFQFQKYGTINGVITFLSPDAHEDEKLGPVYRALVKPEKLFFIIKGKETPVSPGMTVSVEVKTGKRRIIEFFLSPLIKYMDESLKVR